MGTCPGQYSTCSNIPKSCMCMSLNRDVASCIVPSASLDSRIALVNQRKVFLLSAQMVVTVTSSSWLDTCKLARPKTNTTTTTSSQGASQTRDCNSPSKLDFSATVIMIGTAQPQSICLYNLTSFGPSSSVWPVGPAYRPQSWSDLPGSSQAPWHQADLPFCSEVYVRVCVCVCVCVCLTFIW